MIYWIDRRGLSDFVPSVLENDCLRHEVPYKSKGIQKAKEKPQNFGSVKPL